MSQKTMPDQPTGFKNLLSVLSEYKESLDVVAQGISGQGIWTCEFDGTLLTEHPSFSEETLQALVVTDLYRELVIDIPFLYDSDKEFSEENCGKIYGWPADQMPDFKEINAFLHPPLITIDRLLFSSHKHLGIDHGALAWEIEHHGIYGYTQKMAFEKYSANSKNAHEALTAISVYLAINNSDSPWQEPYDPEDDPTCMFGWPESDFPKFKGPSEEAIPDWLETFHSLEGKCRASFFKEDLYTIGRVLATNKATPGSIQSAMEKEGVYGYDKTGRLIFYKPDPLPGSGMKTFGIADIEIALGEFTKPILRTGRPDYSLFEKDEFSLYGWPHDKLPNFKAITADQKILHAISKNPIEDATKDEAQSESKRASADPVDSSADELSSHDKKAYLKVIAGLMWLIQGRTTGVKHPAYKNEAALIRLLMEHMKNVPGANERNLKDRFRDVKGLLRYKFSEAEIEKSDSEEIPDEF